MISGKKIYKKLQELKIDSEYIYGGSEEQSNIASRWNNDKLKVLISTTIGLVGNESSKTQLVCIVGLLYNLPSIVQAMGRIRPHRRNTTSLVRIFINVNNNSKLYLGRIEGKRNYQGLISTQIVSQNSIDYYYKCMTVNSVYDWLTQDLGCRLRSLSKRLGYKQN